MLSLTGRVLIVGKLVAGKSRSEYDMCSTRKVRWMGYKETAIGLMFVYAANARNISDKSRLREHGARTGRVQVVDKLVASPVGVRRVQ